MTYATGIVASFKEQEAARHQIEIGENKSRTRYVLSCTCGAFDEFKFYGQAAEAAEIHKAVFAAALKAGGE
jgi:hypothetical protein